MGRICRVQEAQLVGAGELWSHSCDALKGSGQRAHDRDDRTQIVHDTGVCGVIVGEVRVRLAGRFECVMMRASGW